MLATEPSPTIFRKNLESPNWCLEPKADGKRILIEISRKRGARYVTTWNRAGRITNVDAKIVDALQRAHLPDGLILDGELMTGPIEGPVAVGGDPVATNKPLFVVFDAVADGPYRQRRNLYQMVVHVIKSPHVVAIPSVDDHLKKFLMVDNIKDKRGEGLIIKHLDAMYVPGEAPTINKFKFVKELDAVVMGHEFDAVAVHLGLYDGIYEDEAVDGSFSSGTLKSIGRCSALGKGYIPVGSVVRVRYLYASNRDKLVQPRIVEVRTDKDPNSCSLDQLVHVGVKTDILIGTP